MKPYLTSRVGLRALYIRFLEAIVLKTEYVVHLYTHAILAHLGLPLNKRDPRTLNEAYYMATRIERNISLSGIKDLFTSGTLSMESLFSHENFVDDFQEEGEQTMFQHGIAEDMAEEMEPKQNDEVSTCAPPSDEAIQEPCFSCTTKGR
jgi:hypothetical protein